MKEEIKVPSAGESVTEAIVGEILKPSGTIVQSGDEILELETDKANQIIYAPQSGRLELSVATDDTVTIGQVIGVVDSEAGGKAPPEENKAPPEEKKAPPKQEETKPKAPPQDAAVIRQSKESFLRSSDEPQAPATTSAPQPQDQTRKRMSGLRKTIAKRLVEVKNQTAMLTTFNEVDMSAVMAIRAQEKEPFEKKHGVRLGFMSFFVKASVAALKSIPETNAFIDGNEIVYNHRYDIGISVSTDKGLMVPVIRGCDEKGFAQIEQSIVDYAHKAREGRIAVDDLQNGTFTITNGGIFGSLLSTPILNPPQSAILGMHNIVKRPVVVDDAIVIRPMMYIALSYDHRIIDGKEAVRFLVQLKQNLEEPARLLLDF